MTIRRAERKDLPALAVAARFFFDAAFSASNDPAVMADYMDKAFTVERLMLEFEESGSVFLIAEEDGKIFGYARLRKNPEVDHLLSGNNVELQRFYLDPSMHGTGLADRLMAVCLNDAEGNDWIWLGVWEKNPRALKFYARYGFSKFGTHSFMMGDEAQTDLLLCLRLKTV